MLSPPPLARYRFCGWCPTRRRQCGDSQSWLREGIKTGPQGGDESLRAFGPGQGNYRLDILIGALLEYGNRLAESKKEVIAHER